MVFEIGTDPMERQPLRYNDQWPLHRKLAKQMDSMLEQVHKYQLPFTLTYYEMPLPNRLDFVKRRRSESKKIIKQLSPEQVESLRSLGYVE